MSALDNSNMNSNSNNNVMDTIQEDAEGKLTECYVSFHFRPFRLFFKEFLLKFFVFFSLTFTSSSNLFVFSSSWIN